MAKRKEARSRTNSQPGHVAKTNGKTLRTYDVGALPIINHILKRMRLERILHDCLPPDDPRTEVPTHRGLLVLLRNILISREPIYAIGQWASRHAPDLLELWDDELEQLNDDRLGRCLDRLFDALGDDLIMTVVRQVIAEFHVSLQELHNDSTTVSFFGAYDNAEEEGTVRGRPTLAINLGHSKDHRPDLKQLLYILTVTDDGGVPIYFTSANGNITDDTTHRDTWDLLCQLVGRRDFLYVADCKLATGDNMKHIHGKQGRFVTVLPGSRKEDKQFRDRLLKNPTAVKWNELYTILSPSDEQKIIDLYSVCADESVSSEGYRIHWYHSLRKAKRDGHGRAHRMQRAIGQLRELRDRLQGPRTRFRERAKVNSAVSEILQEHGVDKLLAIEIEEQECASYRQTRRGRPNKKTKYRKDVKKQFDISWTVDTLRQAEEEAADGVFPLISNVTDMTPEELLRAYKRQPIIEKRFSQLKTDFKVASVYLKSVSRIQALLAIYFFVLLVQTLLERELRQAMQREGCDGLPLYAEDRVCRRPTTRKLLDLFDGVQRHELKIPGEELEVMVTQLSPTQEQVLSLLGISSRAYGQREV